MYLLILPAVSKNIIDKGRKSTCVTVSLRTYMYSQLIYLHFGGSYTSFTQLEAEIHALEYKCASNTSPFSLLFLTLLELLKNIFFNTKNDLLFLDVFLLSFA